MNKMFNEGKVINPITERYIKKKIFEKLLKNKEINNKKSIEYFNKEYQDIYNKYRNSELSPLDVFDFPWLYEENMDIEYSCDEYSADDGGSGKWMLYYVKNIFNEKWKLAINLFREKKLNGIVSLKCSTSKKNSRASSHDIGVIILYCYNSDNKQYIIDIGKNILKLFNHKEIIYYKKDIQSMDGTKATGCTKNHTYYLEPQYNFIDDD